MFWASNGRNFLSIISKFHLCASRSINIETKASLGREDKGDITWPYESPGSQFESLIWDWEPSAILHFAPKEITFLAWRILFQAKDPDDTFASKIEHLWKYLALNTL